MKTLQDEVFNKKTGLTETVLIEWTYNPLVQRPEFTVWSGRDNITGNVPTNDLKRLEGKINAIASELSVDDRIETIKGMNKKDGNQNIGWIMNRMESSSDRYIEAERFIVEILSMPWYKRAFCVDKIIDFLKSRKKYKF